MQLRIILIDMAAKNRLNKYTAPIEIGHPSGGTPRKARGFSGDRVNLAFAVGTLTMGGERPIFLTADSMRAWSV